MRVTKLFNNLAVSNSGTQTSAVLQTRMDNDEDGLLQIHVASAGPVAVIRVQGRITSDAPWVDVILDNAGTYEVAYSGYWLIPIFPEMRLSVTGAGSAGTTTVNAWIGD